jgi:hypothetical protein
VTQSLSDPSAGPVRRVERAPDAAYDETAWPFTLPPVRQLEAHLAAVDDEQMRWLWEPGDRG